MTGKNPAHILQDIGRPAFVSFLDMARWMAAGMVLFGHLRNPLFLGYGDVPAGDRTLFVKAWFFVTGWHAEAVIVFFVLSGFLVGGLACGKVVTGRFNAPDYAVDRVSRLFVAFLPALVLTVVLDYAGSQYFAGSGFWNHTQAMIQSKVNSPPFETLATPATFFCNLGMLQNFYCQPYGSNTPLWTISAEFWFYAVFGLVLFALLTRHKALRILGYCASAAIFIGLGWKFPPLLGLWLIGLAAAYVPQNPLLRPGVAMAVFIAVLVVVRVKQDVTDSSELLRTTKNYLVALSFMWLLLSMRTSELKLLTRLGAFNRFLADFSYSLYLIHFPLMLFLLAALHATGNFAGIATGYSPANPQGVAVYAGVVASIYICAYLFSLATERQTGKVRRALKAKLTRKADAQA